MRKLVAIIDKFIEKKIVIGGDKGLHNDEVENLLKTMPKIKKKDAEFVSKKLKESLGISK
jgi:hypothetical protein